MPLNQLLMHATNCSNIYFNLSLFQYLDKHTIQNIALRPVDRKKNRKRNLISANVGILMLGFMLINVTIQFNLHIMELNLGLRQLITSIIYDLALCIITPSVVFYNAPVVRRAILGEIKGFIDFIKTRTESSARLPQMNQMLLRSSVAPLTPPATYSRE